MVGLFLYLLLKTFSPAKKNCKLGTSWNSKCYEKGIENVRNYALEIQHLFEKGWHVDSTATITSKCIQTFSSRNT